MLYLYTMKDCCKEAFGNNDVPQQKQKGLLSRFFTWLFAALTGRRRAADLS